MPVLAAQVLNSYNGNFDIGMNPNLQERVDEHRAAMLLGLTKAELRRYSQVSGLGHLETDDRGQRIVFTYDELRRLCIMAAQSSK